MLYYLSSWSWVIVVKINEIFQVFKQTFICFILDLDIRSKMKPGLRILIDLEIFYENHQIIEDLMTIALFCRRNFCRIFYTSVSVPYFSYEFVRNFKLSSINNRYERILKVFSTCKKSLLQSQKKWKMSTPNDTIKLHSAIYDLYNPKKTTCCDIRLKKNHKLCKSTVYVRDKRLTPAPCIKYKSFVLVYLLRFLYRKIHIIKNVCITQI